MRSLLICLILLACPLAALAAPAAGAPRDQFFWLGQINKATLVVNSEEGLLDPKLAPPFARAIDKVLRDGARPGARRPSTVITFEPLLIEAAGPEITLLHAGRSSQDMHAVYNMAMMREALLDLADAVNEVEETLIRLSEEHRGTILPSYTNGVAAQPTSWGHYLLAYASAFERDQQRLRDYFARVDRSPMGTTVLNGTSWPLDRKRMADYLGFAEVADNAYDANQIFSMESPVDAGHVCTSLALHIGGFIEDVMQQYAQPRPWILLQEGGGNTYVSSAMPQKRNPGILNSTRRDASTLIGQAMGAVLRSHNIPPGMADPRVQEANQMVGVTAAKTVRNFNRILNALVINPDRALEELNLDWTASQELADILMRKHAIPFRIGHHVASEIVTYARKNDSTPLDFPYSEVCRIYRDLAKGNDIPAAFPLTEAEFRDALNPVNIVNNRATQGGPQPAEMTRMIGKAKKDLAKNKRWTDDTRSRLAKAEARLNRDFEAILAK